MAKQWKTAPPAKLGFGLMRLPKRRRFGPIRLPKKLQFPIPDIFAAANLQLGSGQTAEALARYAAVPQGHRAADCIGCKQCERACPQHLKITEYLRQCAKMLEA